MLAYVALAPRNSTNMFQGAAKALEFDWLKIKILEKLHSVIFK